jgi:hypothetical protein
MLTDSFKIVLWLLNAVASVCDQVSAEYDLTAAYQYTETKREIHVRRDGEAKRLRLCSNGVADAGRELNFDLSIFTSRRTCTGHLFSSIQKKVSYIYIYISLGR